MQIYRASGNFLLIIKIGVKLESRKNSRDQCTEAERPKEGKEGNEYVSYIIDSGFYCNFFWGSKRAVTGAV